MIVADTNILASLYLDHVRSEQTEMILQKDAHWIAPLLWRSEFLNVLSLYVRKGILQLSDAQEIMSEALSRMSGAEYEVPASMVLRLAAASGCSAYDCEFVALAEEYAIPLVTSDKQVLARFPDRARSPEQFLEILPPN